LNLDRVEARATSYDASDACDLRRTRASNAWDLIWHGHQTHWEPVVNRDDFDGLRAALEAALSDP
jgi:hypothetical protein